MSRFAWRAVAWIGLTACTTELPTVDFRNLACVDDEPLSDGTLPCPASHACVDGQCTPRLNCDRSEERPGCEPDVNRCELTVSAEVSRVSCESGLYTETSTQAPDPVDCDCPLASPNDTRRLECVAMAGAPMNGAYPLFLLPDGGALPSDALGVPAEVPEWRWCVRPCSSEGSCPPDHTCRPAAVVDHGLLEDQGVGRRTAAVCYPNRLFTLTATTTTSSTAEAPEPPPEPDPELCLSAVDCRDRPGQEACQYQLEPVMDHPFFPAGEAVWGTQRALLGRCVDESGKTPIGRGCVASNDTACVTGLCLETTCAQICDPVRPFDGCRCTPIPATRRVDDVPVTDLVHVCSGG